jgi:peroxiredoxin Q/BCP
MAKKKTKKVTRKKATARKVTKRKGVKKKVARKKVAKRKVAKKKVAKKKVARRKAAVKKTAKKKVTKKRVAKKAARKKATKKKVTRKRVTKKKVVKKKAAGKKVARKKATKKRVAKKTTRKKASGKKTTKTTTRRKATAAKPKKPRRTKHAPPEPRITPPPLTEKRPAAAQPPGMGGPEEAGVRKPSLFTGAPEPLVTPPPAPQIPPSMPRPDVGDLAPDFELPDENGQRHTLSQYRGRKVVIYFYPKDDTPGCTAEACGFRDNLDAFTDRDAVVIGVSPDSVGSHERFSRKYGLTFPLLADEGHEVAEKYGVWTQKQRFGKIGMGIARTTFIIDEGGRIVHVFRNVRAEGHEQEVLSRL